MNILAPYRWIKEFVDYKGTPEQFAAKLSLSGPAIERAHHQEAAFAKIVVGVITAVKPHPNADRLRIATVDLGGAMQDIVCGGKNLAVGMKVAVALSGSKVRWHGQGELIELQEAEIRGVKSNGMICASEEIGLGSLLPCKEGDIVDLSWNRAKAGTPLSRALGLDDVVFDIEVTTNRVDAFSMIGLAREASAILGARMMLAAKKLPGKVKSRLPLKISIEEKKACPRYHAAVIDGLHADLVAPWEMRARIAEAGLRSVSGIVDVTNYVMLEYGQPLHAFDYDKIAGGQLVVRNAKKGEKIELLDGSMRELQPHHLVIADAQGPVAVAGVMGGKRTAVSATTTRIVLESANFNALSVRRTARDLDHRTDAVMRFEKGLPEQTTEQALARAIELCEQIGGGSIAALMLDSRPVANTAKKITLRQSKVNSVIGVEIPAKEIVSTLTSLGFAVKAGAAKSDRSYSVTAPYWRADDIENERDLIEEVARVHGYQALPPKLPIGTLPDEPEDPALLLEDKVKRWLATIGLTEVMTYSFVSKSSLEKRGADAAALLRVANPLSEDFEYLRSSLVPNALQVIEENQGLFPEASFFELSRVFKKRAGDLPEQPSSLLVAAYSSKHEAEPFAKVKGIAEALVRTFGIAGVTFARAEEKGFHPGRTVQMLVNGKDVGVIGEIHPDRARVLGIDGRVAIFHAHFDSLCAAAGTFAAYAPTSQFPPVLRDLAIIVPERTEYADIATAIMAAGKPQLSHVAPFDIYHGKNLGEGKKSIALHLTFADATRTLTADEVDVSIAAIILRLVKDFGAEIRK